MFAVTFGRNSRAPLLFVLVFLSIVAGPAVTESRGRHAGGLFLAALGVMILWFGLIPALRVRVLLKEGVRTQGTVVGAEERKVRQGRTYHPRVQFTTTDGRTVEFTAEVGFSREPNYGGAVPVRYRGDDPEQAVIDRATSWMLEAGFALLAGLGLLVAAVVVYVG